MYLAIGDLFLSGLYTYLFVDVIRLLNHRVPCQCYRYYCYLIMVRLGIAMVLYANKWLLFFTVPQSQSIWLFVNFIDFLLLHRLLGWFWLDESHSLRHVRRTANGR